MGKYILVITTATLRFFSVKIIMKVLGIPYNLQVHLYTCMERPKLRDVRRFAIGHPLVSGHNRTRA